MAATVLLQGCCARPPRRRRDIPVLGARNDARPTPVSRRVDRTPAPAHRAGARAYAAASDGGPRSASCARMRDEGEHRRGHLHAATATSTSAPRRSRKRVSGARKVEMTGQLRNLNQMAARGSLTASRLVPLFLQLQRNREWWSHGPLLASGARVVLRGLRARLPVRPRRGAADPPAGQLRQAQRAVAVQGRRRPHGAADGRAAAAGGRAAPAASRGSTTSTSAAARRRGCRASRRAPALQSMARAATQGRAGRPRLPRAAARASTIFQTRTPSGVRVPGRRRHALRAVLVRARAADPQRLHPVARRPVRLRARSAADPEAQRLYDDRQRARAARRSRPTTPAPGRCTPAAPTQHESDLNYHGSLRDFLDSLCDRTGSRVYCDTRRQLQPRTSRRTRASGRHPLAARRASAGTLRFRLSKISRVSLSLRRGGKVVYSYTGDARATGRAASRVTPPKKAREYDVRITATDLAGNTGVVHATS